MILTGFVFIFIRHGWFVLLVISGDRMRGGHNELGMYVSVIIIVFKMFFYIKIIFFILKKLFLILVYQNNKKN
jgi:hypothetical protein